MGCGGPYRWAEPHAAARTAVPVPERSGQGLRCQLLALGKSLMGLCPGRLLAFSVPTAQGQVWSRVGDEDSEVQHWEPRGRAPVPTETLPAEVSGPGFLSPGRAEAPC